MIQRMGREQFDGYADPLSVRAFQERLPVKPGGREHVGWNIHLTTATVQWHEQQHAGHGLRHTRMSGRFRAFRGLFRRQNEAGKLDQRRSRFPA